MAKKAKVKKVAARRKKPARARKPAATRRAAPRKKAAARRATPGLPQGYHKITPHLVISDAARALDFYRKAFGATELFRMPSPDGKRLMHAEIRIGDSHVMMADEAPERSANRSPAKVGSTTASLHMYVSDADKIFARAIEAGCTVIMPLANMFWGDRFGQLRDPFGHEWSIAQHLRDVSPSEMAKAAAQASSGGS